MASAPGRPLVAALTVHPERIAATRLRVLQYRGHLDAVGLDLRVWTFLDDRGVDLWFGRSHRDRLLAILRGLMRLPAALLLLRRATVVLVHREVLPFGPPIFERLAAWRRPVVWDVDDAIWVSYISPTAGKVPRWLRASGDKYRRTCRAATHVWAGSEVLAGWCRQYADDVAVVPTIVDVPTEVDPAGGRTVSWIGSHSTGPFVEAILPAMTVVRPRVRTVVIGADVAVPADADVESRPWSPAAEEQTLSETRVGLYPVDESHPLAEGKCGFKAILYMSRGIPCVVTPTPTNSHVVRDGVEGLHARTGAEWAAAVERLLGDGAAWQRMSEAAHRRALEDFSLARWGPEVAARLRSLADAALSGRR